MVKPHFGLKSEEVIFFSITANGLTLQKQGFPHIHAHPTYKHPPFFIFPRKPWLLLSYLLICACRAFSNIRRMKLGGTKEGIFSYWFTRLQQRYPQTLFMPNYRQQTLQVTIMVLILVRT